ncbi:MAG: hypothetical protein KatS3mg009_2948 [Acidimicrobiia bacterium]|nr:MAG: hypothetical protein KatS3mg009_2948 [Acidimicrobiia bacterium]
MSEVEAPDGPPAWLERARSDPRFAAAAIALVALAAAAAWVRSAGGGAPPAPSPSASSTAAPAPATTAVARVLVHVAGAVTRAGVVELAAGARVHDAIAAAGGAAPDADLARLNLAAPLADGQRIAVPRVGEVLAAAPGDTAAAQPGIAGGADAPGPLNLNTATAAQLEELPGIGPALAAAIVAERERRGGFARVEDLRAVRGIGEQRFADLRGLVTV